MSASDTLRSTVIKAAKEHEAFVEGIKKAAEFVEECKKTQDQFLKGLAYFFVFSEHHLYKKDENPLRVFRARQIAREHGLDVPLGEGVSLVRDMFVAETMDETRELAGEGILTYLRWIAHWRGLGNHLNPGEELPQTPGKLDLLTYDFLHPRNMLFGTPDYVAEKIEELQTELNLQHLQVWSNFPCVPHDKVMSSVKLFTEEVMPRFGDPSAQTVAQAG